MVAKSKLPYVLAVFATVASGCATDPRPTEQPTPQPDLEECVSQQGQRFLTFCASRDAAELAERQYLVATGSDEEDERAEDLVPLPVEAAPVRGARDAPVTLHLFSDLTCRDCLAAYRRLVSEVENDSERTRLVFRHLPIDEAGRTAARAAIAAGEQGKFYEFLDEFYAGDSVPPEEQWADVAEAAGLDVDTWQNDRRSPVTDAILERDAIQAQEVDVVDAPTFFVNGVRAVGGIALTELEEILQREREHVTAMEDAGLSGADISWRRILQNYQPVNWDEVERSEEELQQELSVVDVPVDEAPRRGAPTEESLVTIVVFADFECEFSAEASAVWNELVERYADAGLRLVFRHFPLPMHERAPRAAAASVLAGREGKFWEFYDRIYGGELELEESELEAALRDLGWTGGDFEEAASSESVRQTVDADRALGEEIGVEGTPTIYVNGIELIGVWSVDELVPLIEDQLELARSVSELTGNSGDELYRDVVEANSGQ